MLPKTRSTHGPGTMARVLRLLPLVLLSLMLAACGGGSSQPAASAPAPARDLSAVRSRTVGAGTAHFTLAIAARVAGAAVRSNETGSISFAKRQAHLYKLLPGGGLPRSSSSTARTPTRTRTSM